MDALLEALENKLYEGDASGVVELTNQAVGQGIGVSEILNRGLLAGMTRVGQDFRQGELFIPEVIVAARAMHAGIEVLKPLLAQSGGLGRHKIVIGTVKGDLHDIGKKLVGIMMQGAGWEVVDLGHDVAPDRFARAVEEEKPDVVGMSALLSTTMPMMKTTLDVLVREGMRERVRVLVGGAPVTQAWADEIGADGYAADAVTAVDRAGAWVATQG